MIQLTENKIAVQALTDPDRTESGLIIIPDEAKERSDQGIVKYIGPRVKDIKIGDYILFSGYTGTTVQMPGDEGVLIIFREEFVIAKIGEGDKGGFENIKVSGLYFKEQYNYGYVMSLIRSELNQYCISKDNQNFLPQGIFVENITQEILEIIRANTPYFPATYEQSIQLCAEALKETKLSKSIELKSRKKGDKNEQAMPDIGWEEMNPSL